jgi:hypothetical protein
VALPGRAYFAAVDGRPQVLAKTEKNELFLPLRTGTTNVLVQCDAGTFGSFGGGFYQALLVRPDTDLPEIGAELRTDPSRRVLFASLGSAVELPWYRTEAAIRALLSAIVWGLALENLSLLGGRATVASFAAAYVLGFVWPVVAGWIWALTSLAFAVRYREKILGWLRAQTARRWRYALAAGAVAVGALLLFGLFSTSLRMKGSGMRQSVMGESFQMYDKLASGQVAQMKKTGTRIADFAAEEERAREVELSKDEAQESYLGLPVEKATPAGSSLYLRETSFPAARSLNLRVLWIGRGMASLVSLGLFLVWVGPLAIRRKEAWARLLSDQSP